MAPAKTLNEWMSFCNNPPPGVTAAATCGLDTFGYSRTVTIDHTKTGTVNSTNFPILFSGTYSFLATVANGGLVQSASGWDIMFTSDAAGNSLLDFEVESYDATTGTIRAWVRIPTLSVTVDTVIYLWYGKNCVASLANKTGVWDSNFMLVWHLSNGTVLSAADSTSNNRTGSIFGQTGNDMATAAFIAGGAILDGVNNYIFTPSLGAPPTSMTLSAWVKPNAAGGVIFDETGTNALNSGWHDSQLEVETNNTVKSCVWIGSEKCVVAGSGIVYGNWYHMATRYDQPGATLAGFVNGALGASSAATKQYPNTGVQYWNVGGTDTTNGGNSAYGSALIDEVRISNIARSNSWLLSEYNNQFSPSTFYTLGVEVAH